MRSGACGEPTGKRAVMVDIAFDADFAASVRTERRRYVLGRIGVYAFLGFFAIIYLLPLFVIVANAFRELPEITQNGLIAFPRSFSFKAWPTAWSHFCVAGTCE